MGARRYAGGGAVKLRRLRRGKRAGHQGMPPGQRRLGGAELALGRDVAKELVETESVVRLDSPHHVGVRHVAEPPLEAI